MSRIQVVKNFTATGDLTTDMIRPLGLNFQPDEAIVRSITYAGPDITFLEPFAVHCSLINDYIGTFQIAGIYGTTVYPQTIIPFSPLSPVPGFVTFRADEIQAVGPPTPIYALTGLISISIDFIKYR